MKIGIMGGTFDPIHRGHLMLGEYAYQQYDLDEVWFMPNAHPPHKSEKNMETLTKHRVEMTKLAIEKYDYFKICLYEVEYEGISFSYKTMQELKKMYPEHEFYFIIGADSLFMIEKWRHPEILLQQCYILAAYRDGKGTEQMLSQIEYLNQKFDAKIMLLKTPMVDIASSEIRKKIKEKEDITGDLTEEVIEYINLHQLYKEV